MKKGFGYILLGSVALYLFSKRKSKPLTETEAIALGKELQSLITKENGFAGLTDTELLRKDAIKKQLTDSGYLIGTPGPYRLSLYKGPKRLI